MPSLVPKWPWPKLKEGFLPTKSNRDVGNRILGSQGGGILLVGESSSGKTTSVLRACEALMLQGKTCVGLIWPEWITMLEQTARHRAPEYTAIQHIETVAAAEVLVLDDIYRPALESSSHRLTSHAALQGILDRRRNQDHLTTVITANIDPRELQTLQSHYDIPIWNRMTQVCSVMKMGEKWTGWGQRA